MQDNASNLNSNALTMLLTEHVKNASLVNTSKRTEPATNALPIVSPAQTPIPAHPVDLELTLLLKPLRLMTLVLIAELMPITLLRMKELQLKKVNLVKVNLVK